MSLTVTLGKIAQAGPEELAQIREAIKNRSNQLARQQVRNLEPGEIVTWKAGNGRRVIGTVIRTKKKNVLCFRMDDAKGWNVRGSLLSPATQDQIDRWNKEMEDEDFAQRVTVFRSFHERS